MGLHRDEAHYEAADEFRIERNPSDHVGFGASIHLCLGAPLARLEARLAVETLLRRTGSLSPAGTSEPVDSFVLRGSSASPSPPSRRRHPRRIREASRLG